MLIKILETCNIFVLLGLFIFIFLIFIFFGLFIFKMSQLKKLMLTTITPSYT